MNIDKLANNQEFKDQHLIKALNFDIKNSILFQRKK